MLNKMEKKYCEFATQTINQSINRSIDQANLWLINLSRYLKLKELGSGHGLMNGPVQVNCLVVLVLLSSFLTCFFSYQLILEMNFRLIPVFLQISSRFVKNLKQWHPEDQTGLFNFKLLQFLAAVFALQPSDDSGILPLTKKMSGGAKGVSRGTDYALSLLRRLPRVGLDNLARASWIKKKPVCVDWILCLVKFPWNE